MSIRTAGLNALGEVVPNPADLVARSGTPDTILEWKALADGLLVSQCCAFHRNMEI